MMSLPGTLHATAASPGSCARETCHVTAMRTFGHQGGSGATEVLVSRGAQSNSISIGG
jgi:hypothetical protein